MLPIVGNTVADAYNEIRRQGRELRALCLQLRTQITNGTVYPAFVLDVLAVARVARDELPGLSQTPGLITYVREQVNNPTLALATEFQTFMDAINGLISAIVAEYPRDLETGRMLDRTLAANGTISWATIPGASMSQTLAAINAYLASLS